MTTRFPVDAAARYARSPGSAAHGNAWLKTGTLRDVVGIAGYVNALNGTRYAVIGFVNHPDAPAGRPVLEALVDCAGPPGRPAAGGRFVACLLVFPVAHIW